MLAKFALVAVLALATSVQPYKKGKTSSKCRESWVNGNCYKEYTFSDFEAPKYSPGNINTQDGWKKTGVFNVNVVPTSVKRFGKQTLKFLDTDTSTGFGDHTYAKPLKSSVGEKSSTLGVPPYEVFTETKRYRHFEAEFDFKTESNAVEPGLMLSVSPDRGDGSRMSYLRFVDSTKGTYVIFDDIQGILPLGDPACSNSPCGNFVEKIIAVLDRGRSHKIGFYLHTPDGDTNDVVKIYIDGKLKHVGTTWEDFYRYDVEQHKEQSSRVVKTLLFRLSGTANPARTKGFLVDNVLIGAY